MKEKKDAAVLEGFFSMILSLFLSLFSFSDVTCIFPFFCKGGTQHNMRGIGTGIRLSS